MKPLPHLVSIAFLLALGLFAKFFLVQTLSNENQSIDLVSAFIIFLVGLFLIRKTANIIEKTTGVLKYRTGLAGGLLQSLGTAFPDMVIGVVSAVFSLQVASQDPVKAINLAIIAASTTFGSNIYNVFHAAWCVYRQNLADMLDHSILMFPFLKMSGHVKPMNTHKVKPPIKEIDASIRILTFLSFLTALVAIGMVLLGKVSNLPAGISGDLYQLTKPLGIIVLLACIAILFMFRKSHKEEAIMDEEDNIYFKFSTIRIWLELLVAGIIILFAAESIIEAVVKFSEITEVPYVITGVVTALVGCLGEMVVIHNFTVNPRGRITDAIIGVAMDNIVTTMGAAFIAIIGGIFLGSDALIIIFVLILFANITLAHEISKLKNFYINNSVKSRKSNRQVAST